MKTRYYILIMTMFLAASVGAQDQVQAFRYSQVYPVGTARYMAMGGAFGAVGGDFTAASVNPAGLGIYRTSEFTITPSYVINKSSSNFQGNEIRDNATNLGIGNLGLVTSYNTNRTQGVVSTTLAFGYNTLNNFHSSSLIRGINNNSSLLDNFILYANENQDLDIFYEDLAFQTGLMPYDSVTQEFWHDMLPDPGNGYDGYGEEQVRMRETWGYIGEYVFSAAMNISNKLYLGGTFGLHAVRFNEDIYHQETDVNDDIPVFDAFDFGEYNSTRGYGYVFKIGMIFRPIHLLRIGASFHAPVVYKLTDDKFTEINTSWDRNSGLQDDYLSSGLFSKEYTLRTPYRASVSAAVVLGKLAIISAEYEYADYSASDLDSPGYNFWDENITIAEDFRAAHNIKAGAELNLKPFFARAGVQYYSNPYADERNGSDIMVYSGGLGIRTGQTFIDFAYALSTKTELYGLYQYTGDFEGGIETSVNNYTKSNFMVTLGYKF